MTAEERGNHVIIMAQKPSVPSIQWMVFSTLPAIWKFSRYANDCNTSEDKWNMLMATLGSFYIEVLFKASKIIYKKSASVAWNTLGLKGGHLREKVKVQ